MATITRKKIASYDSFGGTPNGNQVALPFDLATSAAGVWTDGSGTAAPTAADTLRLGILPAGMLIQDALAIISDVFTATATIKLGFAYVDGVDDTDVPQDADYFYAALAMDALGRTRANNTAVKPLRLPKDAYLVADWDVATNAVVGRADFIVYGTT